MERCIAYCCILSLFWPAAALRLSGRPDTEKTRTQKIQSQMRNALLTGSEQAEVFAKAHGVKFAISDGMRLTLLQHGVPRYIFGVSTGHAGTTSLSNSSSYLARGRIFFDFEEKRIPPWNNSLRSQHGQTWYASRPTLPMQKEVIASYKDKIDRHLKFNRAKTYINLGHHVLHGLMRTAPEVFGIEDALFFRIRRSRARTALSFTREKRRGICNGNQYRVCPLENDVILQPGIEDWRQMDAYQQNLWHVDEVEAEFQRMKQEYPGLNYIECNWSDELEPCFQALAAVFDGSVTVNGEGNHLKDHEAGNRRQPMISFEEEERGYQAAMNYTNEQKELIKEAQF